VPEPDESLEKLINFNPDRFPPNLTESEAFKKDCYELNNFGALLKNIPVFEFMNKLVTLI